MSSLSALDTSHTAKLSATAQYCQQGSTQQPSSSILHPQLAVIGSAALVAVEAGLSASAGLSEQYRLVKVFTCTSGVLLASASAVTCLWAHTTIFACHKQGVAWPGVQRLGSRGPGQDPQQLPASTARSEAAAATADVFS